MPSVVAEPTAAPAPTPGGTHPATRQSPRQPQGWRYIQLGKRDLRLDFLRGFAVFAMVANHIAGHSWLYAITGGNRFFVSAAEGFVFISGVVVGIVYGGIARSQGVRVAAVKLLQRAWLLYVLAVWLAIGSAIVAVALGDSAGTPFGEAPARFVFEIVTLCRAFYLVDVLLFYLFAMLLAAPALTLLERRRGWVVALISGGLWAAYQRHPGALQLPWPIADNPVFHVAPWQVLFFAGLILGHGREWLGRQVATRGFRALVGDGWTVPLGLLFAALLWLHMTDATAFDRYAPRNDAAAVLDAWFDKSALPPARLLACVVVFAFAWAVVTRFWRPLRAVFGPFLLPLGQGALYAYAAHIFIAYVVHAGAVQVWGRGERGAFPPLHPGLNALIQMGALLAIWAMTRARLFQSLVAPLGLPPFRRPPAAAGRAPQWPSESLASILVIAIVSAMVAPTGAAGRSGAAAAGPPASAPGTAPRATVAAPRRIGGAPGGTHTQPAPPGSGRAGEAATQAPGQLRDGGFRSAALGRVMPYGVYLPPGYDGDARRYPVLYMLHGVGGHYSEWVAYGLAEAADQLLAAGRIAPLIIVFPQGDQSYWANHAGPRGERWGDYLANDVVGHIDATYRTLPRAGSRAIGGLSMGGFGALHLAFTRPDVFGIVGAHSPSLRTAEELSELFVAGGPATPVDPLILATILDPARAPRIWLDLGDEDQWAARAVALHDLFRLRSIRHEYHATPGGHDADYWRNHVAAYLRFYAGALLARQVPWRGSPRPPGAIEYRRAGSGRYPEPRRAAIASQTRRRVMKRRRVVRWRETVIGSWVWSVSGLSLPRCVRTLRPLCPSWHATTSARCPRDQTSPSPLGSAPILVTMIRPLVAS